MYASKWEEAHMVIIMQTPLSGETEPQTSHIQTGPMRTANREITMRREGRGEAEEILDYEVTSF